jgi:type VI protein secretion system component Hcp
MNSAIRRVTTRGLVLLVVIAIAMAPTASSATEQVFMQVPGIPGSSMVAGHVGWIEVLSFGGSASAPSSGTTGLPCQMTVQKPLDIASPHLWFATVTGKVFTTIDIQVVAPTTTTPYVLYDILLANAEITSIADSGSNALPLETLTLKATKVTLTFNTRNAATGAITATTSSFTC